MKYLPNEEMHQIMPLPQIRMHTEANGSVIANIY